MKLPRLLAALCTLGLGHSIHAQSTITTDRTVEAPTTAVQTRTVVKADGTVVTEKVTTTTQRESDTVSKTYSAALVISNRAGAQFDDKVSTLEDLLSASLPDLGFNLVSRELVTSNLRAFAPNTPQSDNVNNEAEAAFVDQSSALRLAQNLGTDYLLHASITSFSKKKRNINAYGVQLANYLYTLRVSYKLLDASSGGSLTGGVVTATQEEQNTANANVGFNVVPSDPSTPPAAPGSEAANADEALMRFAKQYEKAIGVVVLSKEGQLIPFGSAWGVGPNSFATNSHITEGVKEYAGKGFSAMVVINKHPDLNYRITKAISHPRYDQAGKGPGGRDAGGGSYDVGILEVDGRLGTWFPVAPATELQRIDSGYRVAYLGFPMDENRTSVDPRSPVATMQTGIVTSNTDWWGGVGSNDSRFLIQHNLSSTGGASGSAIFNTKGQVVALHNAGNYTAGHIIVEGQKVESRVKSGLQIGYAQRADLLSEIYSLNGSGRSAGSNASSGAASKPATLAFLDPDLEPIVNDLLDDATKQITAALQTKIAQNRIRTPAKSTAAAFANVKIDVETADIYFPDVRVGPDKTVSIQDGQRRVAPLDVNVEVDGVSVGSAPGSIKLKPGFSRLRLSRTGYEPWERTINATDGQTLKVALRMNEEGLARWKELSAFLFTLQNGAKLTDAQVELIKGQAAAFANSGYKVDIKVDTKEPINNSTTNIVK